MDTMHDPKWELEQLQNWMQSIIAHPDSVVEGMNSPEARLHIAIEPNDVEKILTRSKALSATDRLGIYSNAYHARLLEVMRDEFPILVLTLEEELFDAFAVDYLQHYPSRSYTLVQLGADFPRYLAEARPPKDEGSDAPDWADFLMELALLERTFSEIFDGPGVEGEKLLDATSFASVPAERWPNARLKPVSCLRLLSLRFPVAAYFTAVRNGEQPEKPEPTDSFLAITRRQYVVRHFSLSRLEYAVLNALVQGQTLMEAIGLAAQESDADLEQTARELREWFTIWAAQGFFSAAEFSDGSRIA